ncbi:hypothetical protein T02_5017 [Trichinella nativa]|uniref:Uncharacterized protein n=1 Tax=Trichinella nativa TaxID=6335 RepID=A0A0V1KLR0_9BILA|nr:hypothetical protein T02_5017 [Trichinella nativa]
MSISTQPGVISFDGSDGILSLQNQGVGVAMRSSQRLGKLSAVNSIPSLNGSKTLGGIGVRRNCTRRTSAILTWRPFTPFAVIALVGLCRSNSSATSLRISDRSDPLSSKQWTSFAFLFSPCAIARTTGNLIAV